MTDDTLYNLRHSAAHLLAAAVKQIWPSAKNAIGPAIDNGFYQDFDMEEVKISENDFKKIEDTMRAILKTWGPFVVKQVTVEQARIDFADNPYKLELIEKLAENNTTITENNPGNFLDLCKGGHSENPQQELKHFTLLSLAGAYWRGSEKNKMLTRIYGTAFLSQEELQQHLTMLEQAKQRDHRKLGKELDLFCFSELVGSGLPLFTPKGTVLRQVLADYLNTLKREQGYEFVDIPHLAKIDLYKISGHWDKFKNDIFHVHGGAEEFVLKPMNCPHHTQIYAGRPRSYRDLPLRYAEITKQYRDEQTGELHGLSRVRSITIDDTHIFARPDQILQEAHKAYQIILKFYQTFAMEVSIRLSTRDPEHKENYLGSDEIWEKAEASLRQLLVQEKRDFLVGVGEAAFYGPKIDFIARDSIGRSWQLSTIQLDFNQPERFQLEYVAAAGQKLRPVMIHVAVAGSLERFMSILIEHYAGQFPTWLAPVQIKLLPVGEKHITYCYALMAKWKFVGLRVEVDAASETIGNKVRKAGKEHIPYVVVIGDKEIESGLLPIRKRGVKDNMVMSIPDFIAHLQNQITHKINS